jgi:hypothetical protein
MRSLILLLTLLFFSPITSAQILTVGLNKLGGQSAESVTTIGAVANRKTSDALYQQALADEKAAWASFPPDAGLLSKALKEAQDGVKADDQSHSMAQEAIHSTETGTNSGHYNAADYNAMGVDDITKMATTSSSLWPQVSAKLKGYGMKLTEDKQLLQTPFGDFPTNAALDEMAAVLKNTAGKFGVSAATIDQGLAAAQANTDAISRKATAEAKAKMAAIDRSKAKAADKDKDGSEGSDKNDPDGKNKREVAGGKNGAGMGAKGDVDWDERAREVNEFRERLQEEDGVEPIWGKDDDIFKRMHEHYVALDKQNVFIPDAAKQVVAAH